VATNLQGRKQPQAPLKTQMEQFKPVKADEERPLYTYVKTKSEEEESDESEDECENSASPSRSCSSESCKISLC
jgi:hypothetical protein